MQALLLNLDIQHAVFASTSTMPTHDFLDELRRLQQKDLFHQSAGTQSTKLCALYAAWLQRRATGCRIEVRRGMIPAIRTLLDTAIKLSGSDDDAIAAYRTQLTSVAELERASKSLSVNVPTNSHSEKPVTKA